jgi:hypothetical protein
MGMRLARRKLIFGWGINDADYPISKQVNGKKVQCPIYSVWANMIKRCRDHKTQARYPTYIGCTVAEEWRSFMAFRAWAKSRYAPGLQLDKDIISLGRAKVYGPDTCLFVTGAVNNFSLDRGAARGDYPIGVYWNKWNKKFKAQIKINGNQEYLGLFDDSDEAHQAWRAAKYEQALILANQQNDEVRDALINYANEYYLPQQQLPQTTLPQQLCNRVPIAFESKTPDEPTAFL